MSARVKLLIRCMISKDVLDLVRGSSTYGRIFPMIKFDGTCVRQSMPSQRLSLYLPMLKAKE